MKKRLLLFILTLLCFVAGGKASIISAHPFPLTVHEIRLTFTPETIYVYYLLRLDPVVVNEIYPLFDQNNNSEIEPEEAEAYFNQKLMPGFQGELNDETLEFNFTGFIPAKKSELTSLDNFIQLNFKSSKPSIKQENSLFLKFDQKLIPDDQYGDEVRYFTNLYSDHNLENVPIKGVISTNYGEYRVDYKFRSFEVKVENQKENNDSNTSFTLSESSTNEIFWQRVQSFLKNSIIKAEEWITTPGNFWLFLAGGFIVFIAGAFHALTPGHGKSFMAAFLIRKKQNSFSDVIVLGLSLTIAHTIVVFALGITLWIINKGSQSAEIANYLKIASGILIIPLGLNILYGAWKSYKHFKAHQKGHDHEDHHHGHSHEIDKKNKDKDKV